MPESRIWGQEFQIWKEACLFIYLFPDILPDKLAVIHTHTQETSVGNISGINYCPKGKGSIWDCDTWLQIFAYSNTLQECEKKHNV